MSVVSFFGLGGGIFRVLVDGFVVVLWLFVCLRFGFFVRVGERMFFRRGVFDVYKLRIRLVRLFSMRSFFVRAVLRF